MGHAETLETPKPLEGAEGARSAVQPLVRPDAQSLLLDLTGAAEAQVLHSGNESIRLRLARQRARKYLDSLS